ncbi:MAG: hypothetical protein ABIS07_17410 [Dokdonella sp.]
MSVEQRIDRWRRDAARRRLAIVLALAAPVGCALVVLGERIGGATMAGIFAVIVLAISAVVAARAWHRIDKRWIARRLDASAQAMDESAALLFADEQGLSALERLQQARLRIRLIDLDADLRPPWPRRMLFASIGLALAIFAVAAAWSVRQAGLDRSDTVANSSPRTTTAISRVELSIMAPAYTQKSARSESALDAKAPEGSHLAWRLRFDPQPKAANLQFHDGSHLALARSGDDWQAERILAASTLYRIVLDDAPPPADDRLHRLDAVADLPPDVRVIRPEKSLTLLDAQQKTWELAFEASDDFGLAHADLTLTLAQGTGENIAFKEQTIALRGEAFDAAGDLHHQRYRHVLDLAALGIVKGDDVIVRLAVTDNREPKPNTTRSASFILRWPVDASTDSAGLEGIVQKTMPAYFRSQRQIIIDSEALLADKPNVDDAHYLARSDALGVDQKILRLRYGQFLGEESEGKAEHAPEALPRDGADTQSGALASAHEAQENSAPPTATTKFGQEGNTVAEYGHVHDIAEAATLLDPDTKATLKSALNEMWQAELHLRQGQPDEALPYEHRALEFIKQVQQSTRIYLARVGLELPVPDEARRLTGERKDLSDRIGTLAAATTNDATLTDLWRALAENGTPDWSAADTWITAHQAALPDALGVLSAIDRARRETACADCRKELQSLLWSLLPTPAAGSEPRTAPDVVGRGYLDAIRADEARVDATGNGASKQVSQ